MLGRDAFFFLSSLYLSVTKLLYSAKTKTVAPPLISSPPSFFFFSPLFTIDRNLRRTNGSCAGTPPYPFLSPFPFPPLPSLDEEGEGEMGGWRLGVLISPAHPFLTPPGNELSKEKEIPTISFTYIFFFPPFFFFWGVFFSLLFFFFFFFFSSFFFFFLFFFFPFFFFICVSVFFFFFVCCFFFFFFFFFFSFFFSFFLLHPFPAIIGPLFFPVYFSFFIFLFVVFISFFLFFLFCIALFFLFFFTAG